MCLSRKISGPFGQEIYLSGTRQCNWGPRPGKSKATLWFVWHSSWKWTVCHLQTIYDDLEVSINGIPKNGWFTRENPIVRNGWWLGVPLFQETTTERHRSPVMPRMPRYPAETGSISRWGCNMKPTTGMLRASETNHNTPNRTGMAATGQCGIQQCVEKNQTTKEITVFFSVNPENIWEQIEDLQHVFCQMPKVQ